VEAAGKRGVRRAVWSLLTSMKELSDLATQHHNLSAAWATWHYSEEDHYSEYFAQHFIDAEFAELADVLGFGPRSLTHEQLAEVLALANFIWNDDETHELL
jgi:hypothetical protein